MDALHPPGSAVSADELEELEEIVQDELPAYLEDLATLVNVDCGSYTKAGVDQVGTWTAGFLERLGAQVEIHANSILGNTVVGTFNGRPGGPRVLLIGHLDTVFPEGTAAARPLRIDAGIARGPGVTDMKSGLLAGLYAILALLALGEGDTDRAPASAELPFERLVFVSGQGGVDPSTGLLAADVEQQTEQCLKNVQSILEAAGSGLQHVLRCGVFLLDMGEFRQMNGVYARLFGDHRPARTTVQVAGLPGEGLRVEIDAIAYVP